MSTDLDAFLRTVVEGYLLRDLEEMRSKTEVGFPIVMAACAGIELLGFLVTPGIDRPGPDRSFEHFWRVFLYPEEPERLLAGAVYNLARNGLGHSFILKGRLGVGRGAHLAWSDDGSILCINASRLTEDFAAAYRNGFLPLTQTLNGPVNHETIAARLDQLLRRYESDAREQKALIPRRLPRVADFGAVSASTTVSISRPPPDRMG